MENTIKSDSFNEYKNRINEKLDKLTEEGKNVNYWKKLKDGFNMVAKSSFAVSVGTVVASVAMIVQANQHAIDPSKPLSETFGTLVATSLGSLAIAGISLLAKNKSERVYDEKNDNFLLKTQNDYDFMKMLNNTDDTKIKEKTKNSLKM